MIDNALREYELVYASTAFEAIREINSRGFHGYLLDYWLPDWSGPSLCRDIRKLDPYAPIVFCTGPSREAARARAFRAGANAFLEMPVPPEDLRSQLGALLAAADIESVRAKAFAERAIEEELERRAGQVRHRADRASTLAPASVERTTRSRALKAFIEARGTRAHFEGWWPHVFRAVQAQTTDRPNEPATA